MTHKLQRWLIITVSFFTMSLPAYANNSLRCELAFTHHLQYSLENKKITKELAQLIFQLELINGHPTHLALLKKTIAAKLEQAYRQFEISSTGPITRAQIDQWIQEQIKEIRQDHTIQEAKQQKGVEFIKNQNWHKPPLYKLFGSQTLPGIGNVHTFEYLERSHSILTVSNQEAKLIDLSQSQVHALPLQVKLAKVLNNGETLLVIDPNWKIKIVEASTGRILHQVEPEITPFIKRNDGGDFQKIAISPNQKFVALAGCLGSVVVFDIQTGKLIGSSSNQVGNSTSWIQMLEFLGNNEVIFNGDSVIRAYDFTTQQTRDAEIPDKSGGLFAATVSADQSIVTAVKFNHAYSFSTRDLAQLVSQAPVYANSSPSAPGRSLNGSQTHLIKTVPSDVGHAVMVGNGSPHDLGIYSLHDLNNRIFDFNDTYTATQDHKLFNVTFTKDKSQMFVLVNDQGLLRVDLWALH